MRSFQSQLVLSSSSSTSLSSTGTRKGTRRSIRLIAALAMLLGPMIGLTGAASAAEPAPIYAAAPASSGARTSPVGTPASEAQTYEAREGQSKSLENFKGGEPIVIYTSTVVLVLLVVLIIVLI